MPKPHTSPSKAKSSGRGRRTMRSSSHHAPQAIAVTRMVWVWSRTECQPSAGISTMLADAQKAPRSSSSSRPARYMSEYVSASSPCLSSDSASTLGPNTWFIAHCSQVYSGGCGP